MPSDRLNNVGICKKSYDLDKNEWKDWGKNSQGLTMLALGF
jgi:hypothetical protein